MVFFFATMALMRFCLVLLCRCAGGSLCCLVMLSPSWPKTLKHHTGFNELQLMEPAKVLLVSTTCHSCDASGFTMPQPWLGWLLFRLGCLGLKFDSHRTQTCTQGSRLSPSRAKAAGSDKELGRWSTWCCS